MVKKNRSTVKIDSALLRQVEEFINLENNRFNYTNKKQFVDLAVCEKLKKEEKSGRKKKC